MINPQFKEWIKLTAIVTNENVKTTEIRCPECKRLGVDYQYVGDIRLREGFLDIWCNFCLYSIHLSRTKVPEQVNMLPFDAVEEYKKKVPKFTKIDPL